MNKLYLMITIVNRAYGEEFLSFFNAQCRSTVLTALGEGTSSREIMDMCGLESTQKAVLFCVVGEPAKRKIFKELKKVMHIDAPGNGIALTLSMGSITTQGVENLSPQFYEWAEQTDLLQEENKMDEVKHELIIVIANQDNTDEIMNLARNAGARGGTLLRAKGTAPEDVKKFFGVNISEDKDMIFIAAKTEDRKAIMTAVSSKNTADNIIAVSFSLPIDSVAGLFDYAD